MNIQLIQKTHGDYSHELNFGDADIFLEVIMAVSFPDPIYTFIAPRDKDNDFADSVKYCIVRDQTRTTIDHSEDSVTVDKTRFIDHASRVCGERVTILGGIVHIKP